MTPREVQWRIEAEIGRENRDWERAAQLACWVINPWIKGKTLRTRDLLGRSRKRDDFAED